MNKRILKKIIIGVFVIIVCFSYPNRINTDSVIGQSITVGIQAGHWPNESGALSCDRKTTEAEINIAVARKIKEILIKKNIRVDILEGTAAAVHNYSASAFVSLHTDYCAGNNSGFKISRWKGLPGSGVDGSGDQSDKLVQFLWAEYAKATNLPKDTSTYHYTPCLMTYYALNPVDWGPICIGNGLDWTQMRGISDDTPGAIIEMGWLSGDLQLMTSEEGQEKMALGISNAILELLGFSSSNLPLTSSSSTVLVFDTSGSMDEPDSTGLTKIDAARRAGSQILNVIAAENTALGTSSQIGLASYNSISTIVSPLTTDIVAIQTGLSSLSATGRTAMADGLKSGLDLLGSSTDKKALILLSDGLPNIGLNGVQSVDPDTIKQEVIDLASQAGQNNTCVYTVGFGDPTAGPGSIDEEFLKQVANASGCGAYYNALDAISLANVYVELRHTSTGEIVFKDSGTISQDEQIDLGQVAIPANQELMLLTLNWPGSKLETVLKDPNGQTVDENYPGVTISTSSTLISMIVNNPVEGSWNLGVIGLDVPEGITPYNAIISTRQGMIIPTPPAPAPEPIVTGGSFSFVILILVLVGGGVGVYVYSNSLKKGAKGKLGQVTGAKLLGSSGTWANQTIHIGDGFLIGRGSHCGLRLLDPGVSRTHSKLRYAQNNWYIQDLDSKTGTYVNGIKVNATRLNSGDKIQIGNNSFTFIIGAR